MAVLAAVSKSILENVGVEISRTLSATSLGGAEWTHSPWCFSITSTLVPLHEPLCHYIDVSNQSGVSFALQCQPGPGFQLELQPAGRSLVGADTSVDNVPASFCPSRPLKCPLWLR